MKNREIADLFDTIADALEFKGENIFRVNTYRKVARSIREFPEDVEKLAAENRLPDIPGVGKGIEKHILEYLTTGRMTNYDEAVAGIPPHLLELLNIPGMGPKTLSLVHKKLGVQTLQDLEQAISSGKLLGLFGMGDKKIASIAKGIALFREKEGTRRISLGEAIPIVGEVMEFLKPSVKNISPCGSLRRMKETIGDIDILCCGEDGPGIIKKFGSFPGTEQVLEQGETKGSIIVRERHLQVDLRVVGRNSYGAALQYFTGSKDHNVKLRGMAKESGLKINEYGVFSGEKSIAGENEEGVYRAMGLPWIAPELREDRGEIEAALKGTLPRLLENRDVRGDLHVHSNYSDGVDTIEAIVLAARKYNYSFIGISDHSPSLRVARGPGVAQLRKKHQEIDEIQKKYNDITILKGAEVDILADGTVDYPQDILASLDYAIGAIHQSFSKNVTERMIRAMENPYIDIIAHPTGRLISQRKGYDVDIEEVMNAASHYGVALEINGYFDRLDLNDVNILKARKKGIMFALGTDSHNTGMFRYMQLAVATARRGWLEKKQVLNCYNWQRMPLRRRKN